MPTDHHAILTAYLCFWLAVLGAVLGSFFDCAVSRWAAGQPPFRGRSRCSSCGHTLSASDLVPVFSFLVRRGRCRWCGAKIPAECLAAELAGAASFLCLGAVFGAAPALGQWLIWAALLLALSLADCARQLLPDPLVLGLCVNRLAWVFLLREDIPQAALTALAACAVPAALLCAVLLGEKYTGRELMGGGDIKLLFALALYFTWAQMLLTLLIGCALGLVWALCAKRRRAAVPFGPFLALGAFSTLYFGGPLIAWYIGLF